MLSLPIILVTLVGQLPTANPSEEVQKIWIGIRESRERLHSGMFKAKGRKVVVSPDSARLEGEMELFSAFDPAAKAFRFDRSEPTWIAELPAQKVLDARTLQPNPNRAPTKKSASDQNAGEPLKNFDLKSLPKKQGQSGGKYVRTQDQTILWLLRSPSAMIGSADLKPPSEIAPFDVRVLGMLNPAALRNSGESLERVLTGLSRQEWSVYEQADGLTWLKQTVNTVFSVIKIQILIDKQHGFTPLRLELNSSMKGRGQEQTELVEMTWEEHQGTWVPRTFKMERRDPASLETHELSFDWQIVNSPIPSSVFSSEGLGLPARVGVVDRRLATPVVIREGELPRSEGGATTGDLLAEGGKSGMAWFVSSIMVALALITGSTILRRHRRNTKP